jgi:bifunctional DNase/RNase
VLLALAIALFLPALALSGETRAPPSSPPSASKRCHPLRGEDSNVCRQMVELEVRDVVPLQEFQTHAVVLVSKDGQKVLPIFVDEAAAVAIAFRLAEREPPQPLAQDLLDSVVSELGGKVTEVRIDSLKDNIFSGRIIIRQGQQDHALEARPSDSIAMALKGGAPILAHRKVLDEAGIDQKDIDSLDDQGPGVGGSGPPPGMGEGPGKMLPPLDLPPGHPDVGPKSKSQETIEL